MPGAAAVVADEVPPALAVGHRDLGDRSHLDVLAADPCPALCSRGATTRAPCWRARRSARRGTRRPAGRPCRARRARGRRARRCSSRRSRAGRTAGRGRRRRARHVGPALGPGGGVVELREVCGREQAASGVAAGVAVRRRWGGRRGRRGVSVGPPSRSGVGSGSADVARSSGLVVLADRAAREGAAERSPSVAAATAAPRFLVVGMASAYRPRPTDRASRRVWRVPISWRRRMARGEGRVRC